MSDWTIEKELCKATGTASFEDALHLLKVLQTEETLRDYVVRENWTRGGAETYIFSFDVLSSSGRRAPLILKAYTPPPGAQSIDEGLRQLVERRRMLSADGVHVPHLYYAGNGVLLEDYIPFRLKDRMYTISQSPAVAERIILQLRNFAEALDRHGFIPVEPFHDLRTDDYNVFVIDFGQDLGPPFRKKDASSAKTLLGAWLARNEHPNR